MEPKCPYCQSVAVTVVVDTEGNTFLLCTDCKQMHSPSPQDPALKEQLDQ
jgi:hypothetical protein